MFNESSYILLSEECISPCKPVPKNCPLHVLDYTEGAVVRRMFNNFCIAEKEK
jgi:hypothetical protein